MVFAFALLMVFLILAAQYEKWSLPIGVLLAVPFALFGALVAILIRGMQNDVYFQIGLTVLIALAAKNAILIFEFAVEMRIKEGLNAYDAAVKASKLRLRPIIMTSLAFILGCIPLAIASGASAASRQSLGTGVIGGMLGATVIAVFFIPMFFWALERRTAGKVPTSRRRDIRRRAIRRRVIRGSRGWSRPPMRRPRRCAGEIPMSAVRWRALARAAVGPLFGALMAGGCAVGPDYERPAVDVPEAYRFAESPPATVAATLETLRPLRQPSTRNGGASSATRCSTP